MPVMCANVARGKLIDDIEGHVNEGTPQRKQELKDLLKGLRNSQARLADLLVQHNIVGPGDPIRDHLNAHWFDPGPSNWWPHNESKEDVIRHGFAEAIRLRLAEDKPICILWVCAGHHFQVAVHNSDSQITVMVLTPHTPYGVSYPASKRATSLRVIGTKRDIDEIVREAGHAKGGCPTKGECRCLDAGNDICVVPIYGA